MTDNTFDVFVDETYPGSVVLKFDYTYGDVTIPQGFVYNGASIPSYLEWLFGSPYKTSYLRASCVHDFLYTKNKYKKTRMEADLIFYNILLEDDNGVFISTLMFFGVILFGIMYYKTS